jgi:hypothetical protein
MPVWPAYRLAANGHPSNYAEGSRLQIQSSLSHRFWRTRKLTLPGTRRQCIQEQHRRCSEYCELHADETSDQAEQKGLYSSHYLLLLSFKG